jgi:hypothetical protein
MDTAAPHRTPDDSALPVGGQPAEPHFLRRLREQVVDGGELTKQLPGFGAARSRD